MPQGLKRFQRAESLHFLTFSCYLRLPLLEAPEAKDVVQIALERLRSRHQIRVSAYVLMPEHVHLLVNEPPSILLAQWLKMLERYSHTRQQAKRGRGQQASAADGPFSPLYP